jgi:hypothetical protein
LRALLSPDDLPSFRHLSEKHSAFASAFPIYLETHVMSTRPVSPLEHETESPIDADEATVEDDATEPETEEIETVAFEQLNKHEPLWMREPKTVTEAEYTSLYKALSKDSVDPLAWLHFKFVRRSFAALFHTTDSIVAFALDQEERRAPASASGRSSMCPRSCRSTFGSVRPRALAGTSACSSSASLSPMTWATASSPNGSASSVSLLMVRRATISGEPGSD